MDIATAYIEAILKQMEENPPISGPKPRPEPTTDSVPCDCAFCRIEADMKDKAQPPVEPAQKPKGPVTLQTFENCANDLLYEAQAIAEGKRPAYTNGSDDVLANFRHIASVTKQTPGEVLAVYMMKHVLAVVTLLTNPEVKDPEKTIGRFADTLNYLLLGWTMLATGVAHEQRQ